jgi:hypothetical protein
MSPLFIQNEDARDNELRRELEQALELYQRADESSKEQARAEYRKLLRAFSARILR